MNKISALSLEIKEGKLDDKIKDIYVDESKLSYQRERYVEALSEYARIFADGDMDADVEIYSAPGRSEIGGNHTDHQHGNVLAASINDDAIAIVGNANNDTVRVLSKGYDMLTIPLDNIEKVDSEEGTTVALIKGVIYGVKNAGYNIGGFDAYITSDVLSGSGLSSSAAFETIIGTILSGIYNDMKIDAVEIAKLGQYAENVYFGKPCGLMDQMACSVGSLCQIDFKNPEEPVIDRVEFDLSKVGYSLCITDTKGSHADLTPDYAAVPVEMKNAASCFGKEFLRDVDKNELIAGINKIREAYGDRAALRALHFAEENERAVLEAKALKDNDFEEFLRLFKSSGDSSYKYLQNVYTNHDVEHQNVSVGLCLSELVLGDKGVARVHGGGFAGTIQAFVKNDVVEQYKKAMDDLFGEGSCNVLMIRKYGGIKVA
ncbi:MAG: galactokinase [Lachnospiraceae bacterium]|nr:galactokinase [Lachnospiraceae bacterium]